MNDIIFVMVDGDISIDRCRLLEEHYKTRKLSQDKGTTVAFLARSRKVAKKLSSWNFLVFPAPMLKSEDVIFNILSFRSVMVYFDYDNASNIALVRPDYLPIGDFDGFDENLGREIRYDGNKALWGGIAPFVISLCVLTIRHRKGQKIDADALREDLKYFDIKVEEDKFLTLDE